MLLITNNRKTKLTFTSQDKPLWELIDGNIDNIPSYIIGTTKDEYAGTTSSWTPPPDALNNSYQGLLKAIANSVLDFYEITQMKSITDDYITDYEMIFSDIWRC